MENFWNFSVWGVINLFAVLLVSLLVANLLKRYFKGIRNSLMPTAVIGGLILLIIATIYKFATGSSMFDTQFFGGNGSSNLEIIAYHCLAFGFIAMALKPSGRKMTKKRTGEIFDTSLTVISSYLIQAVFGLAITIAFAMYIKELHPEAGALLTYGYGQGTGQALNFGGIYENQYGFVGGKNFGLTMAAMGFLCASIGGVIHLNIMRAKGRIKVKSTDDAESQDVNIDEIQSKDELPMNHTIDKFTVQIAFVLGIYGVTFIVLYVVGQLAPGMKSVIFGFNFLIGCLVATLVKVIMNKLKQKGVMEKTYINKFLMDRLTNFFFDMMIVAGLAAIRIELLRAYWYVAVIVGLVGLVITYIYNRIIAHRLFRDYEQEQFLGLFGMLTGTASTGIILLSEIDPKLESPVSENIVYMNIPAIILGLPLMFLGLLAPTQPVMTAVYCGLFCIILNIVLFRRSIFRRRKKPQAG